MKGSSLLTFAAAAILILTTPSAEKVKRVVYGDPVHSHDQWNTYHLVALVKSWACLSDQINHEVGGCTFQPRCTGSLLTPDFIITATHCVTYQLYFGRGPILDQVKNFGFFGRLLYAFIRVFIVREDLHKFYSNIAVLAGSPDFAKMNQKRHAERVFPHPNYVHDITKRFHREYHDIAVVRVCIPFQKTQFVQPAPMLPLNELETHWDSIITRNAACLIVGYGKTDDPKRWWNIQGLAPIGMTYTWRYLTCSSWCNKNETKPLHQYRNPCLLCSSPMAPRFGYPSDGDSGCPIVCDGFNTGVFTASSNFSPRSNRSTAVGYALHCIKNAITPQRLAYYRKVPGDAKLQYLGPVDGDRQRRHAFRRY